jgi:hypothetical protein
MKLPKLRIAWSVGCGIACLLMIVLWVRSYWRFDQFILSGVITEHFACTSSHGRILLGRSNDPEIGKAFGIGMAYLSFSLSDWGQAERIQFFPASVSPSDVPVKFPEMGLRFKKNYYIAGLSASHEVTVAHWMLAASFGIGAVVPLIRRRFSLRTLLIGMTVLAVAIVLIVALGGN